MGTQLLYHARPCYGREGETGACPSALVRAAKDQAVSSGYALPQSVLCTVYDCRHSLGRPRGIPMLSPWRAHSAASSTGELS